MSTWYGGAGSWEDANDWNPTGVPMPGSSVAIHHGTVEVCNLDISRGTVGLGGIGPQPPPVLSLHNAVVGNIELISGAPVPDAGGIQTIDVAGFVAFTGTIAPLLVAQDALTVTLAAGSVLLNAGTLSTAGAGVSATVDMTGAKALLVNQGLVETYQGSTTIDPAVLGLGTFELVGQTQIPIGATVEFGGLVGFGQTVDFAGQPLAGTMPLLRLDDPRGFAGTILGFAAGDTVELAGTAATSEQYAHGVLTVYDGHRPVARLHFAGSYGTDKFALAESGGNTYITLAAHTG